MVRASTASEVRPDSVCGCVRSIVERHSSARIDILLVSIFLVSVIKVDSYGRVCSHILSCSVWHI